MSWGVIIMCVMVGACRYQVRFEAASDDAEANGEVIEDDEQVCMVNMYACTLVLPCQLLVPEYALYYIYILRHVCNSFLFYSLFL